MRFQEIEIPGAFLVDPERFEDERGFFARTFCREEFAVHGLNPDLAQCSVSFNRHMGTLRGLHYQAAPHQEDKLVRCTQGAICDAVVDLRPTSPTFKQSFVTELSAQNRRGLYIPAGLAHGFLTLTPDTEVFYQISTAYHPDSARGARWNDPSFGIDWPAQPVVMSDRDRDYPDF